MVIFCKVDSVQTHPNILFGNRFVSLHSGIHLNWHSGHPSIISERRSSLTDDRLCWPLLDGHSPNSGPLRDPSKLLTLSKLSSRLTPNGGPNLSFSAQPSRESSTAERWKESPSRAKSTKRPASTGPATGLKWPTRKRKIWPWRNLRMLVWRWSASLDTFRQPSFPDPFPFSTTRFRPGRTDDMAGRLLIVRPAAFGLIF